MALVKNLMGVGVAAAQATQIVGNVADNLTATGTAQVDALPLAAGANVFSTVASGTGARLFTASDIGDTQTVYNQGANSLNIYPPVGGTIQGLSVNAALAVVTGSATTFQKTNNTTWQFNTEFLPSGIGGVTEPVQTALRRLVWVKQYGAAGDGVTLDDTALLNAYNAVASGGKLIFDSAPSGYLIGSTFTVAKNIEIEFQGKRAVSAADFPGSYLLKKGTMTTSGMNITTNGVRVSGGGVVGQAGNTGDGIAVLANNVILDQPCGINCGNDGIRVGKDSGVNNSNLFLINKPVTSGNGRHGIYIHDSTSNANAGLIILPLAQSNTGDGIKFGTSIRNVVLAPTPESNTGIGLHFATGADSNSVFGGDSNETNVAGNLVFDAGSTNNQLYGHDFGTTYTDAGTGNLVLSPKKNGGLVKNGTFTRDMSTATGSQAITGVGFRPSSVDFCGAIDGSANALIKGIDDGTTRECVLYVANFLQFVVDSNNSVQIRIDNTNFQRGFISSFDTDGFTISWTKTGTPTGTGTFYFTARR